MAPILKCLRPLQWFEREKSCAKLWKSLNGGGSSYFCTTCDFPMGSDSHPTLALARLQLEPWSTSWLGLPSMRQTSTYWSKSSDGHQGNLRAGEHDRCIENCDKAQHIWHFSSPLLTAYNRCCSLLATQKVHFPETHTILMLFLIAFSFEI